MNKRNLIIYWISTVFVSFGMLSSGIMQLLKIKDASEIVINLGYPSYFLSIIGVWKILAVIAILIPRFTLLKEWAYAGLFFVMTGAFLSHLAFGNYGLKELIGPVMQTIFILLSWYFRPDNRKLKIQK